MYVDHPAAGCVSVCHEGDQPEDCPGRRATVGSEGGESTQRLKP